MNEMESSSDSSSYSELNCINTSSFASAVSCNVGIKRPHEGAGDSTNTEGDGPKEMKRLREELPETLGSDGDQMSTSTSLQSVQNQNMDSESEGEENPNPSNQGKKGWKRCLFL